MERSDAESDNDGASSIGGGSAMTSATAAGSKLLKDAEGDGELEGGSSGFKTGLFGVLYTLAKEKINDSKKVAIITLVVDFLLVAVLFFSPLHFPWAVDPELWVYKLMWWLEFHKPISYQGYTFYLAIFYLVVGTLYASVALCVYTAWCFKNNNFPFVWPIKVLRIVISLFFGIFYIVSLNVFLTAVECNPVPRSALAAGGHRRLMAASPAAAGGAAHGSGETLVYAQLLFGQECLAPPHLIHASIALLSGLTFAACALLLAMADHELEPMCRSLLGAPHSMTELATMALKTVITVADITLRWHPRLQTALFLISTTIILYLHIRQVPYYTAWINSFRAGLCAMWFWISLNLFINVWLSTGHVDDSWHYHYDKAPHQDVLTKSMHYGLGPAFALGCLAAYLRLWYMWAVALRFRAWTPGVKYKSIFKFDSDFDVEVASRVARVWDEDGGLDPVAIELAETVIKGGLAQFPASPCSSSAQPDCSWPRTSIRKLL